MADNLFLKIDFGLTPSTDDGTRPYTGAQPLWFNTSISLSGTGVSPTETKEGVDTTIKVRVSNRTSMLTVDDVKVDAYVMNPFVGAFVPANAVQTLSSGLAPVPPTGAVLECKINAATPWNPTAAELSQTQDGHFCVVANCYADGDGAPAPAGTPFDVAGNRHQGQCNIHVIAAPHFAPNLLPFFVMPVPEGIEAVLDLQPAVLKRLDPGTEDFLARHPAVKVVGEGPDRRLGIEGKDGNFIPITPAERPLKAKIVLKDSDDDDDDDDDGRGHDGAMPMPTLHRPKRAKLRLAETIKDRPGKLHGIDIVQRTTKGEVLGILRVLPLTTA
jgi:hypothetical protein